MDAPGLGLGELPEIYHEEYLQAVEIAKAIHDPASDWDNFVEALWLALVPAFGLDGEVVQRRGAAGSRPAGRDAI